MPTRSTLLAWLVAGLMVATSVYARMNSAWNLENEGFGLAFLGMGLVGALVIGKRPGNRMGLVFAGAGLAGMVAATVDDGRGHPLEVLAGTVAWWNMFFAIVVLVPLLFPTGRVADKRWGLLLWVATISNLIYSMLLLFQSEFCLEDGVGECLVTLQNPIGISWIENPEYTILGDALSSLILLCGVGSLIALGVRFRRAQRVERLQIKWLLWAVSLLVGWIVLIDIVLVENIGVRIPDSVYAIVGVIWLAIPVAAGIAILKYRLFEIDRIVSRSVSYTLLIVVLSALYFGMVTLLTQVLPVDNQLAVAGSTLGTAALFSPIRTRVRAGVDRRFNRAKYNADREIERLSRLLRNTTDIADITAASSLAVNQTVQPSSIAMWVR